jgi:hypothetical protein
VPAGPAPHDDATLARRGAGEFLDQPGPADTGLAEDGHRALTSAGRLGQRPAQ